MENQHGLPQLVHDGFVFRRDRERFRQAMTIQGDKVKRIRTYWRCVFRNCRARGNIDPSAHLHLSHSHNHPRNEDSVKYRNLRSEIKKRALEYKHETPREVLKHFNIEDASLEKTITNWRYRYVREPRVTDDLSKLICKSDSDGQVYTIKEEDASLILQDGCGMFEVEAGTASEEGGPGEIYYIIDE